MGVPTDQLMQMMRSQQGGAGPSAPGAPSDANQETPPMAAPMSTPEPKMGSKEGGMVNLSMARDLISQTLPVFGAESEEGRKILAALKTLNGVLGSKSGKTDELQQSEILQMLQKLPQAGGMAPEAKAMMQAPTPGMPPGMPPGGAQPQPM